MAASSAAYVIQTQLAQPLIQQSVGGSGIAMSAASLAVWVGFEGVSGGVALPDSEEWLLGLKTGVFGRLGVRVGGTRGLE